MECTIIVLQVNFSYTRKHKNISEKQNVLKRLNSFVINKICIAILR